MDRYHHVHYNSTTTENDISPPLGLFSSLVNYVREQLVRSVALMVKRAALEVDKQELFGSILTTVSQLLTMGASMVRCMY